MSCRDWEERIALYAGGDAATAEAAAVEAHVAGCSGCQALLAGLRHSLNLLQETHREPLDEAHFAAVRSRVLARIASEPKPWWRRYWVYACLVAAAAALVLTHLPSEPPRYPSSSTPLAAVPPKPLPEMSTPLTPTVRAGRKRVRLAAAPQTSGRKPSTATTRPALVEPLLVKLITDDPDVVIYWITDAKGIGERP
jgi:hypothetical protein